jgi:hypothetical protein
VSKLIILGGNKIQWKVEEIEKKIFPLKKLNFKTNTKYRIRTISDTF